MNAEKSRWAWVGVACAVAVAWVVHLPGLRSGFVSDDYVYLRAARDLSFADYARVAFTPHADEPLLFLAHNFYRPLYFVSFWPLERLFDGNPLPYHVLLLVIHSASIVMVFVVARALTLSPRASVLAALIFAAHPLPHEAVDWIASLNSIALPLGLASTWAHLRSARSTTRDARVRFVPLSLALFVVALGFRETSLSVIGVIALLRVVPPPEWRLNRDLRSYRVLVPYAVVAIGYYLLRTKLLTEPFGGSDQFDDPLSESARALAKYVSMVLLPVGSGGEDWVRPARIVSAILVCAVIAWSAVAGRRVPLVAFLCGVMVAAPFCFAPLGLAPARYFYFPLAFFSITVAALVEWVVESVVVARFALLRRAAPAAVLAAIVLLSVEQWTRVRDWVAANPDASDAWVGQLAVYEDANRPGTGPTLCAANVPLLLLVFDYPVEVTAQYHFPDITTVIPYDVESPPPGCEDGFVYDDPG